METPGTLYGVPIMILIDTRATENFISPKFLSKFPKRTSFMTNPWYLEYANQSRARVEKCLFGARVDFPNFTTEVDLFVAPLGTYDIILGIKWLGQHKASINCFNKIVECLDDFGNKVFS